MVQEEDSEKDTMAETMEQVLEDQTVGHPEQDQVQDQVVVLEHLGLVQHMDWDLDDWQCQ